MGSCVSVAGESPQTAEVTGKRNRPYDGWPAGPRDSLSPKLKKLHAGMHSPGGTQSSGSILDHFAFAKAVPLPRPSTSPLNSSTGSESSSDGSSSSARSAGNSGPIARVDSTSSEQQKIDVRKFTMKEIQQATRWFRPDLLLGEGGFGKVYMGWVDEDSKGTEGKPVAVKRLNQGGQQGHKEWLTEVKLLSQLKHHSLVQLVGYCLDTKNGERGLVYEYMPKGSLELYLFSREVGDEVIPWPTRMKIAIQVAEGLEYLHDDSEHQQVIYRDFKASNILLHNDFTAKLSDFGLAREAAKPEGKNTHVTTAVMGTFGYTAPEYLMKGHLSARSDVYSFGVVLLEIITGLQSMDQSRPNGQQSLVQYAAQFLNDKRRLYKIIDPRLEGNYSIKAARIAAEIAEKCLQFNPRQRPTMTEVVDLLRPLLEFSDNGIRQAVTSRSLSASDSFRSDESPR